MAPDYTREPSEHSAMFGKLVTLSGMGMSVGPMASGHIVELYPDSGFKIITFIVAGVFAINACELRQIAHLLKQ
jgi:hypothetical protein